MPEELNYDPEVAELKEEIKAMQAVFIDTHKSNEAVKALNKWVMACAFPCRGLGYLHFKVPGSVWGGI